MKHCIKILSLSFILLFILSCGNKNDPTVKLDKYTGRYEGVLNTIQNTRQLETNKCTLIVNEDSSIEIIIEGGNIRDDRVTISKEELTKVEDNSYTAEKNGKKYSFTFYDTYMNLTINNTDNTTSEGKLSKIG
ncbi:hypothetical protein SZ47_02885 [Brachyspira hyodysenteriae]|uniref:Uncharacterized protein n=1 Tax=Brachyspira hyodysenteriae ATCC 27164 TaxID=1266923 RepID=A0A3B6VSB6_BRAHO|nr:hypothetical protein [Brachyspira hyodysenteriae]ANN63695.1 hypothetical protein BHYOB78_07385 [Brachyspira hyodysenteriae ATCC 27164]KLI28246.1 hypothetical protein SZ47_02885 [Brachyspira hyodysenteriae]MCZ9925204.1 hypothetical protein [Brachyspira hyodysenteriae]TVL62249.1 hypothetical protein A9X86_06605 [Brachyspira hyodysenteriae]